MSVDTESVPLSHAEPLGNRRIYTALAVAATSAASAQASVQHELGGWFLATVWWALLLGGSLALGRALAGKPGATLPKQLSDGAAVVGMGAFLYALFAESFSAAMALLLLWLQVAKSVTLATRRDGYFVLVVAFVLLLFAAASSRSGWFLLFIAVFVLAGLYSLTVLHAERLRSESDNDDNHVTVRIGSLGLSLFVLVLGSLVYLIMPRPPAALVGAFPSSGGNDYYDESWYKQAKLGGGDSSDDPSEHKRSPDATPRGANDADNGRQGDSGQGDSYQCLGTSCDITQPGNSALNDGIVFYVQAPGPLYLRGSAFDHFDGVRWSRSEPEDRKYRLERGEYRDTTVHGEESIQQVIQAAADLPEGTLFGAYQVATLQFPGPVIARDRYGAFSVPMNLKKGTEYVVNSVPTTVAGRHAYRDRGVEPEQYLQVPDSLRPEVDELSRRVAGNAVDPFPTALAIERHLRENYSYTLETLAGSGGRTALREFLFETREGHCEYFASAMVIMLRSRGIPARLVTGFVMHRHNPLTGFFEVRGLDGHAWVEVWLERQGQWVLFEPTPPNSLPEVQSSETKTTAEEVGEYIDQTTQAAEQAAPEALSTRILQVVRDTVDTIGRLLAYLGDLLRQAGYFLVFVAGPWLLAGAGLILALGFLVYRLRIPLLDRAALLRLRWPMPPVERVKAHYREFEGWYRRRGHGREAPETPEEYAGRMAREWPQSAEPIRLLAGLFVRARYGLQEMTAGDADAARAAFRTVIKSSPAKATADAKQAGETEQPA